MQQHVGHAQHVGELLLLDAEDGLGILLPVLGRLHLLVEGIQPAGDETARTTGEVGHLLPHLGLDDFGHEIGQGAGRVELTCRACALHLLEDGLINLAEGVAFLVVAKVELVDDVDHLTEQHAVLHVLVGILEGGAHDGAAHGCLRRHLQILQGREQGVVDEIEQGIGRQSFACAVVLSPGAPAAVLGDERDVVVFVKLPVILLFVVHFQEQHPCDLLDALGITVDTGIVAHDVADILYKIGKCHVVYAML